MPQSVPIGTPGSFQPGGAGTKAVLRKDWNKYRQGLPKNPGKEKKLGSMKKIIEKMKKPGIGERRTLPYRPGKDTPKKFNLPYRQGKDTPRKVLL